MNEKIAITKNVLAFMSGIEIAQTPVKGRVGNMLVEGVEGTGKTDVGRWYALQNNIPYVRVLDISSRRDLLEMIATELGLDPDFRAADLHNQIVEELLINPRPVIVDEVDYLVKGAAVEVLRDINDVTNTPIIMMGMGSISSKLKRFKHLYDRFVVVVKFELFSVNDIAQLATELCTVALSDDAIRFITRDGGGKLRTTTTWFSRAEALAKRNELEVVTAEHLQGWQQ